MEMGISSNDQWCARLKPTVSIVTCGEGMSLPDEQPLKNLKNVKSEIYTTGKDCNRAPIEKVGGITEVGDDIIVTVPKGGNTFTVSSPNSELKTYEIKQKKKEPISCELLEA